MKALALTAIISLLLTAVPVFAIDDFWHFDITANANNAFVGVMGAGAGGDESFGYSVATSGGILGSGNIQTGGGGSNYGGGAGIEIGGSGAEGDIFATHDLTVNGCCAGQCPCPTGYEYEASSNVLILGGDDVELKLKGGAGTDGAGQSLKVGSKRESIDAESVEASMTSSITVNEETSTHTMGAYGENVWFFAKGKQGLDAVNCGVDGFFISVMGYNEPLCEGENCPPLE